MSIAHLARTAFRGRTHARKAATIAVALSLATGALVAVTQQTATAASCTSIAFVGVRGSGEAPGLGGTVQAVYNALDAKTSKSITKYALPYPAAHVPVINKGASVNAFINSVNTGKTNLTKYVTAQSTKCPSQKIVLAGFSQGALVITQTMRSLPASVLKHVTALTLIGDPAFDPKFAGDVGTYAKNDEGIVSTFTSIYKSQNYLPAAVSANARSYCLAYDPVCNYSVVSLSNCLWFADTCSHAKYVEKGYARKAGQFLATKV
jgi:cutinase